MPSYRVNWPLWERIIDKKYLPLVGNRQRYVLLPSTKSAKDYISKQILYRALTEKYFRFLIIRADVDCKESGYNEIRAIIEQLDLRQVFLFEHLEINCINGNQIIFIEEGDHKKIRVKDITGVWYEPETPIEVIDKVGAFIKPGKSDYLQEIFTYTKESKNFGRLRDHFFNKHNYTFEQCPI